MVRVFEAIFAVVIKIHWRGLSLERDVRTYGRDPDAAGKAGDMRRCATIAHGLIMAHATRSLPIMIGRH